MLLAKPIKFIALYFLLTILPACGGGAGNSSSTSYSIGGTVSGLIGSVVLQNNNINSLSITSNGAFIFTNPVANLSSYNISILTQPAGQTCSVSNGTGTVTGMNVSNIALVCSTISYSVGGTITGLAGTLVLQDNNSDNLTDSTNGTFTFASQVANGSPYGVTVFKQPVGQGCSVVNGTGTITLGNVNNVGITCITNTYTIGGTITGLNGNITLQDNGADNYTVSTNGNFSFPTTVAYGNPFNVSIYSQPAGQTCALSNSSGTANANLSSITVTCANNIPVLSLPSRSINPGNLAVIVSANDPNSVAIANYYQSVRGIPAANIITANVPTGSDTISDTNFTALKAAIDAQLPSNIQATLLTWTAPSRVVGTCVMSITSAMAFGFDPKYCETYSAATGCAAALTATSPYFNSESAAPWQDFQMRPSMMLGASSVAAAETLINTGVSADATYPAGDGYLIYTSDPYRNTRTGDYPPLPALWTGNSGILLNYIDNSAGAATDSISGKSNVLFYFTGLASVPNIASNTYRPGAIADSLTSLSGFLPGGSGQMPITSWLNAGVTASYGTVAEPCSFPGKFSQASVLIDQYYRGATLIEAYWKAVQMPGQGLFIGEPLAQPFKDVPGFTINGNQYQISTRALRPYSSYSLQYLTSASSTWTTLKTFTAVTRAQPQVLYAPLPPANATQIRWVGPCTTNSNLQCTLSTSN